MAQITRYKDFSDSKAIIEAQAGQTVARAVGFLDWSNYVVIVNGEKKDEKHLIQEGDLIIIRSIPKGAKNIVLGILTGGIYNIIKSGVDGYKARKAAEAAQAELEKLRGQTQDGVTNVPYMRGASNSVATGKTQPYVIGTHLFTPYILNGGGNNYKGFHTISGAWGADSFYTVVLECGFGKQVLDSLSCDDVKVASLLREEPQEGTIYFNSNSAFASADSYVEIAQDGQDFEHTEFNTKIVEQELSDQLRKADDDEYEDLYYTLEKNARACDVAVLFNGLYSMTDSGTKGKRKVEVIPEYSVSYAQATAEGKDASEVTDWKQFTFRQKYEWTETIHHKGTYSWYPSHDPRTPKSEWEIMRAKSSWTLVSGEDLRDDPNATYSYSRNRRKHGNWLHPYSTYDYTITAEYTGVVTHSESDDSNVFEYNENRQLRFEAHKDFAFSECFHYDAEAGEYRQNAYPITIRLRCATDKVTEGTEVSDCYAHYVHSYCYDVEKSAEAKSLIDERIVGEREAAVSVLLGLRVKATQANEDKLGKINVITHGIAPVCSYDEEAENPDFAWDFGSKVMTDNPASWLLEVLMSDTHRASKVSPDEIDLQSFGELYKYCHDNGIGINLVLTQGQKKAQVLEQILSVCHAALYQNIYGKMAVAIDDVKENAVALLNEQNLVSFSYEKQIAMDVDGVRVKFVDSDSDYQENSFVRLYDADAEYGEDTVLTEISATGVTNREQAHRYSQYLMASSKLRQIKATATVGAEGFYFAPYSKVLIQHPALKVGLGNAVVKRVLEQGGLAYGLELYDAVEVDSGNQYYIQVQCVCADGIRQLILPIVARELTPVELEDGTYLMLDNGEPLEVLSSWEAGHTRRMYYVFFDRCPMDSAAIPHNGDVLSYGYEPETVTQAFTISGIRPNGQNQYSLDLVEYDERIFDFDADTIPEYAPTVTVRRPVMGSIPEEPPEVYPTYEKANEIAMTLATQISHETVINETPKYLGILTALPESANYGDWFTAGDGMDGFARASVYRWSGAQWLRLDITDSANSKEMMAALNDVLSLTAETGGDGYFSTVFAKALIANTAFINNLGASVITMMQKDGKFGLIKSANFDGGIDSAGKITGGGTRGWAVDYDGNASFNAAAFTGIKIDGGTLQNQILLTTDGFIKGDGFNLNSDGTFSINGLLQGIKSFTNGRNFSMELFNGLGIEYGQKAIVTDPVTSHYYFRFGKFLLQWGDFVPGVSQSETNLYFDAYRDTGYYFNFIQNAGRTDDRSSYSHYARKDGTDHVAIKDFGMFKGHTWTWFVIGLIS